MGTRDRMGGLGQDSASPKVVPMWADSQAELAARMQACWEAGHTPLPLPARMVPRELRRTLESCDLFSPPRPGAALVVTTSGSTGEPKNVELSHAALTASARASLNRLGAGPGDRWLCCLPLYHIAGIQVLVRSRLLGVPPVIHDHFDPAAVRAAEDVTLVALVPTMLYRLLEARVDVERFRAILLGGGPPPPGLLDRARDAGARVVESYGMTETCGGCVYDGVPLDGVEVRIGRRACVEIAGPVLMDGYRNDPRRTTATLAGGWLRTEDVGTWDDRGRLRILGRADEVIITGGEKVRAREVAALLVEHPAVADAHVFGRSDGEWGERVVARIVPAGPPPTLAQLRAFVKQRAAAFKAPAELEVVESLPAGFSQLSLN